jgi:hypothetical protein
MLSIANVSAAQIENYYEADDYYTRDLDDADTGTPSATWYGKGATALGLTDAFNQSTFQQLLHGKGPNGESLHARKIDPDHHRAVTDCTFSAPKSVSIAALIQGDPCVLACPWSGGQNGPIDSRNSLCPTRMRRPQGERERVTTGNVDLSRAIQTLSEEDYPITPELLAGLSPYLTSNIKRYGDYILDLLTVPLSLEEVMVWPIKFPL